MPKVSSVEPQKKNPSRFNIFLDGQFAFGADEDLVVEYRVVPGKTLEPDLVEKLLFEASVGKLMERMYRLFNIRPRSEKEVRDYLRNLSFKRKAEGKEEISDTAIDLLIKKLKEKGFLSDESFAKAWVEARRRSRQKGLRAIRAELLQKGIDKEIIGSVLDSRFDGEKEKELASLALEKKMKVWQGLSNLEFKKKAYQFLGRKGFEYDIIRLVVEKFTLKR